GSGTPGSVIRSRVRSPALRARDPPPPALPRQRERQAPVPAGILLFSASYSSLITRYASRSTLVERLDERHDLFLEYRRRDRPDALVADHAQLVDHVGLGHAVDPVVDADAAIGVDKRDLVRVAEAL